MLPLGRWVVCALLLAAGVDAAQASPSTAASAWAATPHGEVRLIAGVTAVGESGVVPLGLEFRLAPGWKIYWRSPGDAGYPPQVDWSGSGNLAAAAIAWPAPARFTIADFETVGYAGTVVLPVTATLQDPAAPLSLAARVDYLTCKEICVPYLATLALTLPAGPAVASAFAPLIDAAQAQVPKAGSDGPVVFDGLQVVEGTAGASLRVGVRAAQPLSAPDLFIEGPADVAFGRPQVALQDDGRRALLTLPLHGPAEGLSGQPLTLTLVDGSLAVEQRLQVATAPKAEAAPSVTANGAAAGADRSLWAILAVAVLGGLILNLMPCVLPVLSIKLLAVVSCGGSGRRAVRRGFLASAAGIIVSFWVLAAAVVALAAAGIAAGWGWQFQQPLFVVAMVLVVTLFAANLWGLFEVPLPSFIARLGAGGGGGGDAGLAGPFLTGALATVLATPCSAPFVGTAVSFALTRGPGEIFAVFTALGFGLALPYLAVAAVPALATRLPRPGPWMITLKRLLALALLATAAWLLMVLAGQAGLRAAVGVTALALAIAAVLALAGRYRAGPRWLAPAAVVLLGGASLAVPLASPQPEGVPPTGRGASAGEGAIAWQPFEPGRIPALIAAGHTVFVNVTADWCLTCKVNERLVLERDAVKARLAAPHVVAMQADWTRRDAAIGGYLASFGRHGIPFDAVYGPGVPSGEALPELLTPTVVLQALDRAEAERRAAAAASSDSAR